MWKVSPPGFGGRSSKLAYSRGAMKDETRGLRAYKYAHPGRSKRKPELVERFHETKRQSRAAEQETGE
jgi:hypothetical protein